MKTIVNYKNLTFLFAFTVTLHIAAAVVSKLHPLLALFLDTLELFGGIAILWFSLITLVRGVKLRGPKIWRAIWNAVRVRISFNTRELENASCVSVEELESFMDMINRLGLALTPEKNTDSEDLTTKVPVQYAAMLSVEFESLIRMLKHFGFPSLENVQLQQRDFDFAQEWGSDLEARLQQSQHTIQDQQQKLQSALAIATQMLTSISTMYPTAIHDAGYQRMQGALKLLKKLAQNSQCPDDLMLSYIPALQRDIQTIYWQARQAAA